MAYTLDPTSSNSSNAAVHNITHYRGDTLNRLFRFWQDDAKTVPLDITTSVFKMDIATPAGNLMISLRIGDGLSFTASNILSVDISYLKARIKAGVYKYDIEQTLADGVTVKTRFQGTIKIDADVTPLS